MAIVGPALERRQELLGRYVEIGVELFAMACTVSRAASRMKADGRDRTPVELADHFCRVSRRRIAGHFHSAHSNDDKASVTLAKGVLDRRYDWLEQGILPACPEGGAVGGGTAAAGAPAAADARSTEPSVR
jgi:hypothetical protein